MTKSIVTSNRNTISFVPSPVTIAAHAKRRSSTQNPTNPDPDISAGTKSGVTVEVEVPAKLDLSPSHQEVVDLLQTVVGLPFQPKSSDHYGDPKGPRLVLPKADRVRRIFLYRMDEFVSLPGYRTPEERKVQKLGAVTHVVDVTDMDRVRVLVTAVAMANGLKLPSTSAKKQRPARSRKGSPASGVTVTPEVGSSKAEPEVTAQITESDVEVGHEV